MTTKSFRSESAIGSCTILRSTSRTRPMLTLEGVLLRAPSANVCETCNEDACAAVKERLELPVSVDGTAVTVGVAGAEAEVGDSETLLVRGVVSVSP